MKKIIMILALLSVFSVALFADNGSANAPERTEGKWTDMSYVNVPILKILEGKDGYAVIYQGRHQHGLHHRRVSRSGDDWPSGRPSYPRG